MEDGGDYNELELGSKTWNRMVQSAAKTGYREGVDKGSEQVLQSDFDKGYEDAFKVALILGRYKALSTHLLKSHQNPPEIDVILEATRRGECYICKLEVTGEINQLESSKVIEHHRNHVERTVQILNNYFTPLLTEKEINFGNLSLS